MHQRSEWQPCNTKVHRMCPWRQDSVYYIHCLWTGFGAFHPPIWLQSYSGAKFTLFWCLYNSYRLIIRTKNFVLNYYVSSECLQRILEHCVDQKTLSIVMDDIMQSLSTLSYDQYGNYVVQVSFHFVRLNHGSLLLCLFWLC